MAKQILFTNLYALGSGTGYGSVGTGTQNDNGENGYVVQQTSEGDTVIHMPSSGTCRNLVLNTHSSGTPGAGTSIIFTVRKNESDTSVVATLSDSDTTADSSSNNFTFAAGDRITIKVTVSGSPTAQPISVTLEMDYDEDVSIITGGFRSTSSTIYGPFGMYGSYNNTSYDVDRDQSTAPFDFTITKAYVYCTTAPGASASGKERGISIRRDAGVLDTFRVVEDANEYSETGLSISISEGDNLGVVTSLVSGPDASRIRYTLVIEPTVNGDNWLSVGHGSSWASSKANTTGAGIDNATEYLMHCGPTNFQLKDLYSDSDAIGGGASRDVTLRKNQSNTVLAASHTTTQTQSSDTNDTVDFAEGDNFSIDIATPGDTEEGVITMNLHVSSGTRGMLLTFAG